MRYPLLLCFFVLAGVKLVPGNLSISLFDGFSLFAITYFLIKKKYVVRSKLPLVQIAACICFLQFLSVVLYEIELFKLVFALRFFEYFIYLFFAAFYFSDVKRLDTVVWLFFIFVALFSIFPVFPGYRYGLFNYAWEMPAVIGLLATYLMFTPRKTYTKVLVFIIAVGLILFSGQRTPFVAFLLVFGVYAFRNSSFRAKMIVPLVGMIVFWIATVLGDLRVFSTLSDVFNVSNAEAVRAFRLEFESQSLSYENAVYGSRSLADGASGDLSLQLRLRKWVYAWSAQYAAPYAFLVGLGPGFFGGAADSSILRVFFETGILGLILWVAFFKIVLRCKSDHIFYLTLCFLLNAIFIDTLYSSRVFPLYLILVGSYFGSRMVISNAR